MFIVCASNVVCLVEGLAADFGQMYTAKYMDVPNTEVDEHLLNIV